MKYKTLFRLMLKVIGVWAFVWGASSLLSSLSNLLYMVMLQSPRPGATTYYYGFVIVGPMLQTIAGLYLFFGGRWITDHAIPSNRPYCHECGYELTGASPASELCPECGTPFRAPALPIPPTRS